MSGLHLHDSFEPYYAGRGRSTSQARRFARDGVRRGIDGDPPADERSATVDEIEAELRGSSSDLIRTDAGRPPR